MATAEQLTPLPGHIIVRKCTTGQEEVVNGEKRWKIGGIYVTDHRGNYSHWCEIVKVGNCKHFTDADVGGFVHLTEWKPQFIRAIVPEEEFVVSERLFEKNICPAAVWR